MSSSYPRWFRSSVSNDTNMVTYTITILGSKIYTGPAMSTVFPLSQDSCLSHSLDELFQTLATLLSLFLSYSSQLLQVALCFSSKIFCCLPSDLVCVCVTLNHFIPVVGKSDRCAVENQPFFSCSGLLSSAAVKDLLSHLSSVCFLNFPFILTL